MTLPRASLLASIGVLLVLPLLTGSSYFHHLLVLWMLYALLALSLNIIVGYLGELSFGHAAFFGIGAYAAAILTMEYGVPAIRGAARRGTDRRAVRRRHRVCGAAHRRPAIRDPDARLRLDHLYGDDLLGRPHARPDGDFEYPVFLVRLRPAGV